MAMMDAAMRASRDEEIPSVDGMFGFYLDALPSDALIDLLVERRALVHAAYRYDTGNRPGRQEGPNYGYVPASWDEDTIERIPATHEPLYVRGSGSDQS